MSKPTRDWLLDPIFPTTPAVPHLDAQTRELAGMGEPDDAARSGTWLVASRVEDDEDEDQARFATSDSEAPTIRPGSLHAAKAS
jgi:hypothetical protein